MAHPSTFDEVKKGAVFKALAAKSTGQVATDLELDKYYKSISGMRNIIFKIYAEVIADPEKFAISSDTIDLVRQGMDARKANRFVTSNKPTVRETKEEEFNKPFSELAQDGRNKALRILHKKLDRIEGSRKKLDNISAGELAKVYGIMFDKSQIIKGEATEHVKILSKNVNDSMSAEERLDYVLKLREINNEAKEKKKYAGSFR